MASDDGKHDGWWATLLILFTLIVALNIYLDVGRGVDIRYASFFGGLLIVALTAIAVLQGLKLGKDNDAYRPALFDDSPVRLLADKPWSRTIAAVILLLIFVGASAAMQQSVVPVINPYDSTSLLTKEALSASGENTFSTAVRSGVYPGLAEELVGYLLTTVMTFGLMFAFKPLDEDALRSVLVFIVCALISSAIWAVTFATAHEKAYGLNDEAYYAAAFFGFVNQLANQFVGAPVSILPHFGHNLVFVLGLSIIVAAGAAKSLILFVHRKKGGNPMHTSSIARSRKGSGALITLVIILLALVVGAVAFMVERDSPLNAGAQSCTDFVKIEPGISCSSDESCVSAVAQGGPADPNVALRCTAGMCEAKILSCTSEVSA